MRAKIIAASLLAALLSTTALADTSSMSTTTTGMGVLANDYVTAGVNGTAGTFGSGGNTSPGLLFDSTGTGTFNTGYDYLTPGSPFDGFAVMVDGTNYTNNNGGASEITGDGNGLTDGTDSLSWTGGVTGVFDITNTYSLGATDPYIDITSQITMGTAATDVYFGRFIDPDARAASGDSSSTDNVLGYGSIPDSNVAFSEALSSRYALGLYSTDSNVDAGITGWTTDANSYTENAFDSTSNTNTGDNTIGLSWHWTSVSSGDILTASYAYIFGPSAFDAASDAVDGGAGGGADVTGGAGVTDVGSATDAASGTTTTPTVTGTTTTTDTSVASTPSSHTDVEGDGIVLRSSHIAGDYSFRNYSTDTATEFSRTSTYTTTTTTTVTDTYSDGTTTDTVTTASGTTTDTETYFREISVDDADILAGTTAGTSTSVSQGIDETTIAFTIGDPTFTTENQTETMSVTYTVTGEEVYEVTTPTLHTYDRTTTTTTVNDFEATSVYTDTTDTVVTTSSVSETYDIVTEDRETRTAGVTIDINSDDKQGYVIADINKNIVRGNTFGDISFDKKNHNYGIYDGNSTHVEFGGSIEGDGGVKIGAGMIKSSTSFTGNTSTTDVESTTFGATVSRETETGWSIAGTIQRTNSDIKKTETPEATMTVFGSGIESSRITLPSIGSYNTDANGENTSASVLLKGPEGTIRPIVGYTVGRDKIDRATTDLIPGVLAITHDDVSSSYNYATIGGELNIGMLNVVALHHTDGVNDISLGISKETEGRSFNVSANRMSSSLGDTNSINASITWKF